jgi:hypothetical protein
MHIAKAALRAIRPAQAISQILGETDETECILKLNYSAFDA